MTTFLTVSSLILGVSGMVFAFISAFFFFFSAMEFVSALAMLASRTPWLADWWQLKRWLLLASIAAACAAPLIWLACLPGLHAAGKL